MRARLAAVAALSVGLLLTGCGVPSSSGVQVDGPVAEQGNPGDDEPRLPPGPDDARSADELVAHFLQAAAGNPDDAVEQLRPFVHRDRQSSWDPDGDVLLVRAEDPISTPVGIDGRRITVTVQVLGVLRDGMIVARDRSDRTQYEFEVVDEASSSDEEPDLGQSRWRIVNPPDAILLSDEALSVSLTNPGYLEPSPIYFWDSGHRVLVPDLRWLPTALPARQRAQLKLQWLIEGPAPWLDSVARLPGDVGLEGNIVWTEDRVDVAMTPAAKEVEPAHLDTQLWWTLRGEVGDERDAWLLVDGAERSIGAEEGANASVARSRASLVLVDGQFVPYSGAASDELTWPDLSDVAGDPYAVALSRDGQAAVAYRDAAGLSGLAVVTGDQVAETGLSGTTMSRPVWLTHPTDTGLVAVDGELYRFGSPDEPAPVTVPGVTGEITALAVPPDGRRVALVADGELYIASLARRDEGLMVGTARWLPTTGNDLAGVTFLQENWLAVIGQQGGQSLLYELTVDGAVERELVSGELGAHQQIGHMVGYPGDVLARSPQRGEIMYEADGFVYRYRHPNPPDSVSLSDLGIEADEDAAGPHAPVFVE